MKHLIAVLVLTLSSFCCQSLFASTDTIPTTVWTSTYNGAANLDDVASAVTVGSSNSIYATGYETTQSTPVIKTIGWVEKLSSAGVIDWTTTFSTQAGISEGKSIDISTATDSIFVGGIISRRGVLRKYNATTGALLWATTVQSAGQSSVNGISVTTSNITVTGYVLPTSSSTDFALLLARYSHSGLLIWTTSFNLTPGQDVGNAVVDKNEIIYVCGSAGKKIMAGTFRENAILISTVTFGGAGLNTDQCLGMAVDETLSVYMVGYKEIAVPRPQHQVGFVQKIGSDGLLRWTTTYSNGLSLSNNGLDRARSVSVASATVFVAGTITSTTTAQDLEVRQYDTDGLLNWTTSYSGIHLPARDYATGIAAIGTGFVVTGAVSFTTSTVYSTDIATGAYRGTDGIIRLQQ